MIVYDNAEADTFTKEIVSKQGFGTLQAWLLDPNPQKHAQLVLDHFHLGKEPPTVIYDVGCGTGEMLFQVGERFPRAFLHGINRFSSQVDDKAVEPLGITTGNFETSPDPIRSADLIMCNYTLGHFKHAPDAIMHMRSTLSRRGKLCMYDICRRSVLWDGIYGYHLYSQRELHAMMSGIFRRVDIWVPNNATLSPILDANVRQDFLRKTLPVFIVGEE